MSENGQSDKRQVVLEQEPLTGLLTISGNVTNLDIILGMLAQATRHVETQFRINAGIAAQQVMHQRKEDEKLAQSLSLNR